MEEESQELVVVSEDEKMIQKIEHAENLNQLQEITKEVEFNDWKNDLLSDGRTRTIYKDALVQLQRRIEESPDEFSTRDIMDLIKTTAGETERIKKNIKEIETVDSPVVEVPQSTLPKDSMAKIVALTELSLELGAELAGTASTSQTNETTVIDNEDYLEESEENND